MNHPRRGDLVTVDGYYALVESAKGDEVALFVGNGTRVVLPASAVAIVPAKPNHAAPSNFQELLRGEFPQPAAARHPLAAEAERWLRRSIGGPRFVALTAEFQRAFAGGNALGLILFDALAGLFDPSRHVPDVDVLGLAWSLVTYRVDPALLRPAHAREGARLPSDFDVANIERVLNDEGRYTNFDAHLFRLIKKAGRDERERLRVVYPFHLEALEAWELAPPVRPGERKGPC